MAQVPAIRVQNGDSIDYVPGSAVAAGDVVVVGGKPLIAHDDIASGALGALFTTGLYRVPKKTGAIALGDPLYWNPTGDPNTGTAGTGSVSNTAALGAVFMGFATLAALSADDYVYALLASPAHRGFAPVQVVAAAGSAQGDAVGITVAAPVNVVHVTGADATKGAILPTAVAGMIVMVKNQDAANAILKVYPATGAAINALAANGAISMAAKTSAVFMAISATQWFTIPLLPS